MNYGAFSILRVSLAASILLFGQSCSQSSFSGSSKKKKSCGTTSNPCFSQDAEPTESAVFAVRDLGCAMCHAKVDSNIITDFNFDRDELTQHQAVASILHTLTEPDRPV